MKILYFLLFSTLFLLNREVLPQESEHPPIEAPKVVPIDFTNWEETLTRDKDNDKDKKKNEDQKKNTMAQMTPPQEVPVFDVNPAGNFEVFNESSPVQAPTATPNTGNNYAGPENSGEASGTPTPQGSPAPESLESGDSGAKDSDEPSKKTQDALDYWEERRKEREKEVKEELGGEDHGPGGPMYDSPDF